MNTIVLEPLKNDVDFDSREFDCGEPQINKQIQNAYFRHILKQLDVYSIKIAGYVVGYVAISVKSISINSAEGDIADYFDGSCIVGAVKVDFIGIDKKVQRNGIGTAVIELIVKKVRLDAKHLPIRILMIDAISTKTSWYHERGFKHMDVGSGISAFTKAMYLDLMDEKQKAAIEEYVKNNL